MSAAFLISAVSAFGAVHAATPFEETWVPNVDESTLLPGQTIVADTVGVIKDDGVLFQTELMFTVPNGEVVTLIWNAVCDGRPSPVEGVNPPGSVTLNCIRNPDGSVSQTLVADGGYSHTEVCSISTDGLKKTCEGTARFPDGSEERFRYVDDRR
jgi:hypothetical protein